jgi:hypothetical protein
MQLQVLASGKNTIYVNYFHLGPPYYHPLLYSPGQTLIFKHSIGNALVDEV